MLVYCNHCTEMVLDNEILGGLCRRCRQNLAVCKRCGYFFQYSILKKWGGFCENCGTINDMTRRTDMSGFSNSRPVQMRRNSTELETELRVQVEKNLDDFLSYWDQLKSLDDMTRLEIWKDYIESILTNSVPRSCPPNYVSWICGIFNENDKREKLMSAITNKMIVHGQRCVAQQAAIANQL